MPQSWSPRTACVLGFHRSGTSLTARVLSVLGVALGEDLLPAHETDNPRGYWEPRWMNDLNDELFAALRTTWWQPFPVEPGWHASPQFAELRERAATLYARQFGDAPLSGWKDPRSTLTLPFWQALAPDPVYVICIRNPIDAIASIQRRPDPTLSTTQWGELWLEYTARAFQGTTARRRLVLFYDDWFEDPRGQVAALAELLGVGPNDARDREAEALVEGGLRHHRTSPRELAAVPALSAAARTAYLALRAAHGLRRTAVDDGASPIGEAIERVVVDAWLASRETTGLRQDVAQLPDLHSQVRQLMARLDEADAQVTHLRTDAERRQAEADRLRAELTRLEGSRSWRMTAPLRALKRRLREPST